MPDLTNIAFRNSAPPAHPAFATLINSITPNVSGALIRRKACAIERDLARAAAGDECTLDRMAQGGVTAFDLSDLANWLLTRADQLEGRA